MNLVLKLLGPGILGRFRYIKITDISNYLPDVLQMVIQNEETFK